MALTSSTKDPSARAVSGKDIPLWIKLPFTLIAVAVFVAYWDYLGPANYLWFSDIALFLLVPALWIGSRLIASAMAVAVLIPEIIWVLDFITFSQFSFLTNYMFDPEVALHIRALSATFHIAIPLVLIYMLYRFGYDSRGLPLQCLIAMLVLPMAYIFSGPEANINWVYGPGTQQELVNPWVYLALLWVALVVVLYIPSHLIFKRIFNTGR